ncbi:unnamed protein product [Bursaphelenchus xylophilus]|uniref:(pine wood nematode) hypothetical protein n=1 Tax=Bursaphelenchus xylophilus TaxID=6326 RepID=A0A1I7RKZ3_BURXY|nr:unnamed protein product [Bursaphelenchus xylophilus]CAG9083680.1 unnamed protein product [Bursaphelenchus xylophilus]
MKRRRRLPCILSLTMLMMLYSSCGATECRNGSVERIVAMERKEDFITSPGYPLPYQVGVQCLYELEAPLEAALVIKIELLELDLSEKYSHSKQCLWDYIIFVVFDREGKQHVSKRYCGRPQTLPTLDTMQSKMHIIFVSSDQSQQEHEHRGFKIRYTFLPESEIGAPLSVYNDPDGRFRRECGGSTLPNEITGEITNPGFPLTYPRNITCFWLIRVPAGHRVYVRLTHLQLSTTVAECDRASLSIIEGYRHDLAQRKRPKMSTAGTDEVQFCGSHLYYNEEGMKSYLSNSNRVVIRFNSMDYPSTEQQQKYHEQGTPIGFKILWTEVHSLVPTEDVYDEDEDPECKGFTCKGGSFCLDDGQNICAERTRLCINETLRCNGVSNCAENDDSDEELCYTERAFIYGGALTVFSLLSLATCVILKCCLSNNKAIPSDQVIDTRRPRIPPSRDSLKIIDKKRESQRNKDDCPAPRNGSEMVVWQIASPRMDRYSIDPAFRTDMPIERALV